MARDREVLLTASEIGARIEALADRIAPEIDDETVCVTLLTGGMWFAADLTRALHTRGRDALCDGLWLASYGDEHATSGSVKMIAGLQRDITGRKVLLIDDVIDSGLSLAEAVRICREAGASAVLSAVFARKPWDTPRPVEPDFAAWDAPAAFLVGYGMDDAGHGRGSPDIYAV